MVRSVSGWDGLKGRVLLERHDDEEDLLHSTTLGVKPCGAVNGLTAVDTKPVGIQYCMLAVRRVRMGRVLYERREEW